MVTWKSQHELGDVEEASDAVADCVDEDDEDEDGGDVEVPALPLGGVRDQEGLLADKLVDEAVEEYEGGEGNDRDDHRRGRWDLANYFRFLIT